MTKIFKQLNKTTVLLFMMFLYSGIGNYLWRVLSIFIPISFSTFTGIVWTLVIFGTLPLFCKRLRAKHLIIYLLAVLFFLVQWILADQSIFDFATFITLILSTLTAFFVGVSLEADENIFDPLYVLSILVLLASIAYSFYYMTDRELLTDNMGYAYNVLPSIMIIVSGIYRREKRKLSIILSVIAFAFLLALGTRGPLLCFAVFVLLMTVKSIGFTKISIAAVVLGITFSVFINSTLYTVTMLKISNTLGEMGFSTRIMDMILEENLSDDNGRDAIQNTIIKEIREEPLAFRGVFSDRVSTRGLSDMENHISYENGTYAHNLILEFLHNYGIAIGGLLLILLFSKAIKLFLRCKKETAYIVVTSICIGIVQLFVSSSYVLQPVFFMIIGLFMNETLREKNSENNTVVK